MIASGLTSLRGWRRALLALTAGALCVLAFAPFHAWPVLLLTFPVLVWMLDGCCLARDATLKPLRTRVLDGAWVGWLFGFGFFLAGVYWIGFAFLVEPERFAWLLPFAVSSMPAGLALFFAAGAALACAMWRPGTPRIFGLAASLTLTEWLRGHIFTGFPWITLGYALTGQDALMQAASLIGVYGLTPIAILALASPAALLGHKAALLGSITWRAALPATMAVLLASLAVWGELRLRNASGLEVPNVRMRLVQPNIPQAEKWKPASANWVFNAHLSPSAYGNKGPVGEAPLQGITHLIWPEAAVPFLLAEAPDALELLANLLPDGAVFMTGALRIQRVAATEAFMGRRAYNSIFVMDDEARMLSIYDKQHLVPFGEYLPYQETMEQLGIAQLTGMRGGFSEGTGERLMQAPGVPPFIPLICYEIIFPRAVRPVTGDPQWMLNVTNDGWFGVSTGPYQHLAQARVRAVEEGLPVIRVANSGISAVIDPQGRVLSHLPLEVAGVIDTGLPRSIAPPLYARAGLFVEIVIFLLVVALWAIGGGFMRPRIR